MIQLSKKDNIVSQKNRNVYLYVVSVKKSRTFIHENFKVDQPYGLFVQNIKNYYLFI